MGWDAFATQNGNRLERDWHLNSDGYQPPELTDPVLKAAFSKAEKAAKDLDNEVDWLLQVGALDCSCYADALEAATGMECWSEDLTAEEVQEFASTADWSQVAEPYASARLFLETCAKHGLGIRFSW